MPTLDERLWHRIDRSAGPTACWPWLGGVDSGGYGTIRENGHTERTHRIVYRKLVGPIPEGWTIDHLCRNRRCLNSLHLEAVTRGENVRRGAPFREWPTHCPQGHPHVGNRTADGRSCRLCANEAHLRKYHATKILKGRKQIVCRRAGHPLTPENRGPDGSCRICARAHGLAWYHQNKSA